MPSLTDFISRIGEAGVEASKACEAYHRERLAELCDKDDDGNLIPRTLSIKVGEHTVEVPLISLMTPTRVDIERLNVKFKTTIYLDDHGAASLSGHIGLLKRGVGVSANVTFKAAEPLEAIEILREKANKILNDTIERGLANG